MEKKSLPVSVTDHPGVYIPPPLVYVSIFFLSILFQRLMPLPYDWLTVVGVQVAGVVLIGSAILSLITSLWQFVISKNTLIPIKAAHSLQTSGVYSITRNPMYLGLLLLYFGIAIFKGNLWTLILAPVIVLIIQTYVIKKEEEYLKRAFGNSYVEYQKKVRRWI